MIDDAVFLARIQFAFTMAFHIIFPSFTIGLVAWIATLEAIWLSTGRERYYLLARFWTKIFAISFAMGVVSGLVMSYPLGTNWSRYSRIIGNIIGPMIGYEVVWAFFLEATSASCCSAGTGCRAPHFAATVTVTLGTTMSAFWICQQTVGCKPQRASKCATAWRIRSTGSPSSSIELSLSLQPHDGRVLLDGGICRCRRRRPLSARGPSSELARTMLRMGLRLAIVLAPAQALIGDVHELNTLHHQPAKIAGMEAHWKNDGPVPLVVLALPNEKAERNDHEIAIPYLGSLILSHSLTGSVPALKDFSPKDRPPVLPIFLSFRFMVGIGFAFIFMAGAGGILGCSASSMALGLSARVALVLPLGVAIIAGWTTTRSAATGSRRRLRTADAASHIRRLALRYSALCLGLWRRLRVAFPHPA
jgi:cytochrome d ubiquinol oxidase subunit I